MNEDLPKAAGVRIERDDMPGGTPPDREVDPLIVADHTRHTRQAMLHLVVSNPDEDGVPIEGSARVEVLPESLTLQMLGERIPGLINAEKFHKTTLQRHERLGIPSLLRLQRNRQVSYSDLINSATFPAHALPVLKRLQDAGVPMSPVFIPERLYLPSLHKALFQEGGIPYGNNDIGLHELMNVEDVSRRSPERDRPRVVFITHIHGSTVTGPRTVNDHAGVLGRDYQYADPATHWLAIRDLYDDQAQRLGINPSLSPQEYKFRLSKTLGAPCLTEADIASIGVGDLPRDSALVMRRRNELLGRSVSQIIPPIMHPEMAHVTYPNHQFRGSTEPLALTFQQQPETGRVHLYASITTHDRFYKQSPLVIG